MVDSLVVKQVGWNDLLDDLLSNLLSELLGGDVLGVLGRNNDGVDTPWNDGTVVVLVLDGDLGLGVGSEPWESAVLASSLHCGVQLVCKEDCQWQHLRCLVGGITEHDTLVTGTELLEDLLVVETLCDIWTLLFDSNEDVASLVVKALGRVIVANVLDSLTNDLLVVNSCLGGNFTKDHDHTGLGSSLASNLGRWVLGQAGVEHSIGDLVSDLVWVATADRLGGEEEGALSGRGTVELV